MKRLSSTGSNCSCWNRKSGIKRGKLMRQALRGKAILLISIVRACCAESTGRDSGHAVNQSLDTSHSYFPLLSLCSTCRIVGKLPGPQGGWVLSCGAPRLYSRAPHWTSAEPAEAYPPSPRLRRVTRLAFIVRRQRLWPTAVHGLTPLAFCEDG